LVVIRRKTPPYSGTTVDPATSKAQIEKLLRSYGVDGVQWSEMWTANKAQLQFVLSDDKGRRILIRLEPPPFSTRRRTWVPEKGRYEQVDSPNWAQSYRLLYSYLKAKLESIAYGLRDVEEEFLSDMILRDRDGHEVRVGEIVARQLDSGELRPALGPGEPPRDPASTPRRESTEAGFREVR
jgi:hypothetical protein